MLALVLADGDLVGLVQQDVRDLQDRVREQADRGAVGALLRGLVLELRHPGASPKPVRHSITQLSWVCSGTWLCTKTRAALRVETGGQQLRGGEAGVVPQRLRVLRDGDRVQVDDHVERVVRLLQRHPLAHGAEVVAEVERTGGGLDPGEHTRTVIGHAPIVSGPGGGRARLCRELRHRVARRAPPSAPCRSSSAPVGSRGSRVRSRGVRGRPAKALTEVQSFFPMRWVDE